MDESGILKIQYKEKNGKIRENRKIISIREIEEIEKNIKELKKLRKMDDRSWKDLEISI